MRFHEFTADRSPRPVHRPHIATLTVEPDKWGELRRVRKAQPGPTRIIAVRGPGPSSRGSRVDIQCEDWEAKVRLTLDWYSATVLFADVGCESAGTQDEEFAPTEVGSLEQLSTATLHLAQSEEWQRLDALR